MKVHWKWSAPVRIGLPVLEAVQGEREYDLFLGDIRLGSFDNFAEARDVANKICALCEEVRASQERAASEVSKVPTDILKFEPVKEEETYRFTTDGKLWPNNPAPSAKFEVEGIGDVHVATPLDVLKVEVPSKEYEVTGFEATVVDGIGDVNGTTKGSGARYNTNKPQFDLIPVRTFIRMYEHRFDDLDVDGSNLYCALTQLAEFQEGDDAAVAVALQFCSPWAQDAVRVLEFGAKKYAEWNWAKGMSWQTIIGCALRHAKAVLEDELLDAESGQTHLGHFLCNLVFLDHYVRVYREGDDRPPAEFMK